MKKQPGDSLSVLFVLENYHPNIGGVENLFKSLAEHLAAQGHRVAIVTTRLSSEDPAEETLGGIRIFRHRFFNRYLFTLLALLPVLRHAGECDLVHTTSYNAALPAWLGARLRGRKVVVTFHEVWASLWLELPFMGWAGKRLHWLFEQMLLRLDFDCFAGVSNSTADRLAEAGVARNRVRAILNGIDYRDFSAPVAGSCTSGTSLPEVQLPATPASFTYAYFGRLGVSKGLDVLLEGARLFRQRCPDSRLKLIVPKTPAGFFKTILVEIEKKGLGDHVQLLHHLPFERLKAELVASDCVVIPSLSEGFCFAAVESAALGVPVVSSGRAALKEVVSGRFVNMKELMPSALADALEKARVGEWEQSPLRKFEIKDTVAAYLDLYRELLAGKKP